MTENKPKIVAYLGSQPIYKSTLGEGTPLEVDVMTYGATLTAIRHQDIDGRIIDTILGFDSVSAYMKYPMLYFGSTVGRYANRIAHGRFTLDNESYSLDRNLPPHHLHGGKRGFDKVIWDIEKVSVNAMKLSYLSTHMEEGYPGNVKLAVEFRVNGSSLHIMYSATTDLSTPINLTNHAYFNLNGQGSILDHDLQLDSNLVTEVDDALIPTGKLVSVFNTPLDFLRTKKVGVDITSGKLPNGYDHNYVIENADGTLKQVAMLQSVHSNRYIKVSTTEPAIQLYTGNGINNVKGKGGKVYQRFGGLCLETQHYPDSPNQPSFPSTILHPGDTFSSETVYEYGLIEI